MKPFPCIEATLDVAYEHTVVRLWLDRDEIPWDSESELREMAERVREWLAMHLADRHLFLLLTQLPRLNAVQVIRQKDVGLSFGTVVYTVDFSEDVHG